MSDLLVIAGALFSRCSLWGWKYRHLQEMGRAHAASGADMVTVLYVDLISTARRNRCPILSIAENVPVCLTLWLVTPLTSHSHRAAWARSGLSNWVKLEVIGDQQRYSEYTGALIEATRVLVKEGFVCCLHERPI